MPISKLINKLFYSITNPVLNNISVYKFLGNFILNIALFLLKSKSEFILKGFELNILKL